MDGRIPIVSGIPDSLRYIPDSKTQARIPNNFPDSGFHKQNKNCRDSGFGFLAWREDWALGKSDYCLFHLKDEDDYSRV